MINEEKRFVVGLLSPYLTVIGQKPILYVTTIDELGLFTGGLIDLLVEDTANIRYVRGWEEVEVIKIENLVISDEKGMERVLHTIRKGSVKIIYTAIKCRIINAKSKDSTFESAKKYYYRGYYIDEIKNLGIVTKDGYIPIDKGVGVGNTLILQHNKRHLIKRGAKYIHNQLECIMGFIDKVYLNEAEMQNDKSEIDLGFFIDSLLL